MIDEHYLNPRERTLWGVPTMVTPALVNRVWGNGKKLIAFEPLATRPHYYIIQGDSAWDLDTQIFFDLTDEVYEAIAEQYGDNYDNEDEEPEEFPVLDSDCGSSWWELDEVDGRVSA